MWQPSWACPTEGYFYPPTLFTDVAPAATIAQVEIFGPVLVAMTFRTPAEAVALANNTRYGLAASVWSENVNLALDVAREDQGRARSGSTAPTCSTPRPASAATARAASGARAGARACSSTCEPDVGDARRSAAADGTPRRAGAGTRRLGERHVSRARRRRHGRTAWRQRRDAAIRRPRIDRTPKLFIGGKQARPDSGYSRTIYGPHGEAASARWARATARTSATRSRRRTRRSAGWASATAHNRAQILYYIAENLSARARRVRARGSCAMTGRRARTAAVEVERRHRAALHLCGLGRQVRRRGARDADPRR